MVSGTKPWSRIILALLNVKFRMPTPASKITPRSRARLAAASTLPSSSNSEPI